MKNNITIRMGGAHNDVTVRGADGVPVVFNRNKMTKKANSEFHRELMNAFRASGWEKNRSVAA